MNPSRPVWLPSRQCLGSHSGIKCDGPGKWAWGLSRTLGFVSALPHLHGLCDPGQGAELLCACLLALLTRCPHRCEWGWRRKAPGTGLFWGCRAGQGALPRESVGGGGGPVLSRGVEVRPGCLLPSRTELAEGLALPARPPGLAVAVPQPRCSSPDCRWVDERAVSVP